MSHGVLGLPPTESRISQSLSQGEKFVDQYYKTFSKSASKYYSPSTRVIWNGTAMSGDQFLLVLPELQQTMGHFDVHAFDAQPVGSLTMINVSGVVKMKERVQFAQTFVVQKTGTMTYIVSDCFRLV
ncbi:NTF2- export protein 2 [Coemansia sp. RSA 1822]|nr:NTF2- export protein 2 [Coemansia sp. RSA 638]KAJ2121986.1 NTF2- export protein 2 [Coemansia sp. RSA 720]KAJ2481438.1 NTF2- export protein 2 [Coemansia sp. RSA 2131]KAJ2537664.1 NTF2- export protein 2 [Coemansia sp. RSA 1853]KAJ2563151.1 NTF2- export protein 2 [Coemansia sp. RSA 1822]KAJ2660913.1 NTF2- export protein 2 [Coemansia sp. RSA 1199]